MVGALISAAAVVLAPLLGSAFRASRRNRLVGRVRTFITLADDVEAHDPASATALRQLASKGVEQFIALERVALDRRFDPAAPFAFAIVLSPAAIASYFRMDASRMVDLAGSDRVRLLDRDLDRGRSGVNSGLSTRQGTERLKVAQSEHVAVAR